MKKKRRQKNNSILKKKTVKIFSTYAIIIAVILVFSIALFSKSGQKEEISNFVTIRSPQNKTYSEANILVTVVANDTVLWIKNSFDDGPNITECGNCNSYTRYDKHFKPGIHTIVAYVSDHENRVSKTSVVFTVK